MPVPWAKNTTTVRKLLEKRKRKRKKKKLLQMDFYSKPDTKAPKRREFIWLSAPCHLGYSKGSELLL